MPQKINTTNVGNPSTLRDSNTIRQSAPKSIVRGTGKASAFKNSIHKKTCHKNQCIQCGYSSRFKNLIVTNKFAKDKDAGNAKDISTSKNSIITCRPTSTNDARNAEQ